MSATLAERKHDLAMLVVKKSLKKEGVKISDCSAKDLHRAAGELVKEHNSLKALMKLAK